MVTSTSRLAYGDCFDLMDKAIADPKGIQVKFAAGEEAWHFRIRLHTARKIDRHDNMQTYPESHPMHGKSVYDVLTMRIRSEGPNGMAWLRLERIDAREFEIESLSEPEVEPELTLLKPMVTKEKLVPHVTQPIRPTARLRRL
jgi:hypothetical protein